MRVFTLLLFPLLLTLGCTVEQDPDWLDPEATSSEGTGENPGDMWCSLAVDALVQHNGQPVPGELVQLPGGEWPLGCACVADDAHLAMTIADELDGVIDSSVIMSDDHPLAPLRDAIHTRTRINCQRRAYEIAEELFCAQYCGPPYNYDWSDFKDFTEENCREVVVEETPLIHVGTLGDCDIDESNPLP